MKGRVVLLDRWKGREAAALVVDGRLEDLLIDPPEDDAPRPVPLYLRPADAAPSSVVPPVLLDAEPPR